MAAVIALTAICNVLNRIDELGALPPVDNGDGQNGSVEIQNGGSTKVDENGFVVNTVTEDIVNRLAELWRTIEDRVRVVTVNNASVINIETDKGVDFRFQIFHGECGGYFDVKFRIEGKSHVFQMYATGFDQMAQVSHAAHLVFARDWEEWTEETLIQLNGAKIVTYTITDVGSRRELSVDTIVDPHDNCFICIMIDGCDQLYYDCVGGGTESLARLVENIEIISKHAWVSGGNR